MSWMNKKTQINIVQIIADIVCLAVTYAVTIFLTGLVFRPVALTEYLWIPVLFSMVYVFTMYAGEMYNRSTFTYQDRTLKYVMKACIFAALFCYDPFYYKGRFYSKYSDDLYTYSDNNYIITVPGNAGDSPGY